MYSENFLERFVEELSLTERDAAIVFVHCVSLCVVDLVTEGSN